MKISLDGTEFTIDSTEKNLVEAAEKAGIAIPAPCFRTDRSGGCCRVCVVEADGEEAYACCTPPREGMNIIVNREDLNQLRKERMKEYLASRIEGNGCGTQGNCGCSCSCSCSSGGGSCC